ncbi:sensor histidine kinase [Klenkia sp. PcliD-1-E]|uniref:sensor histidine kinase n=1 Tax=Klenkia sp. PcliD-1-E TaxID=2954492 RepID=UPI002097C252|nr:histidine kinase [Klenkia sp. PcliD-1-E]MCO7221160.1 histidine kinase [Klenkia sp. PcliD-1-E]
MDWGRRHRGWGEVLLVVVVLLLSVQDTLAATGSPGPRLVLAVAASLALPARHRFPLTTTLVAVAALALVGVLAPVAVALFHLAGRGLVREALGAAAVGYALNVVVAPPLSVLDLRVFGPSLLFVLAIALGSWVRSRRRLEEALAEQVDRLRVERELGEQVARASERSRIAAEMHDVLAHRLSLIALHTGVLARREDELPAGVAERLALLRSASTDALADLRDVLGALRDTDRDADAPAPAHRGVAELVAEAITAGQDVELVVRGDAGPVPSARALALDRVVQESLSNARKHAPGTPVRVEVHHDGPVTRVTVSNPLPAEVATSPGGFGLVGMGERAAAVGGGLTAGPDGDRWVVRAELGAPDGGTP